MKCAPGGRGSACRWTALVFKVMLMRCAARRRAAKRKMKQMKSHSSKEAEDFDEEAEDMFSEFG